MKAGVRAVGVAESFTGQQSTLAGVVSRADGVIDGLEFASCTVGGFDATDRITALLDRVVREDVKYVFIAGIAPAWYNILDLEQIQSAADRPVIAVTFEDSEGLRPALEEAFDGETLEARLERYDKLPERTRVRVNDETLFVRAINIPEQDASEVIRAFTPAGGRPEPLRVARLAARAADRWRDQE